MNASHESSHFLLFVDKEQTNIATSLGQIQKEKRKKEKKTYICCTNILIDTHCGNLKKSYLPSFYVFMPTCVFIWDPLYKAAIFMVPTICPIVRVISTTHTHVEGHSRANRQVGLLPGVALVTRQLPLDGAWQGAVGGLVDVERPHADTVHVVPEGEAVD